MAPRYCVLNIELLKTDYSLENYSFYYLTILADTTYLGHNKVLLQSKNHQRHIFLLLVLITRIPTYIHTSLADQPLYHLAYAQVHCTGSLKDRSLKTNINEPVNGTSLGQLSKYQQRKIAIIHIHKFKHVFWVLKRTLSMRRFF